MPIERRGDQRRREPEVHALLHALWGKAKDAPGYDKREWQALQRWVLGWDRRGQAGRRERRRGGGDGR